MLVLDIRKMLKLLKGFGWELERSKMMMRGRLER